MEGFHKAIKATVETLAEGGMDNGSVNIVPGFLSPSDLRAVKDVLSAFGLRFTLFPDYSETLDGESWSEYQKLSGGGTPVQAIKGMGRASATIQLGKSLEGQPSAGRFLEERFGVRSYTLGLPIGIRETDRFVNVLSTLAGAPLPERYEKERGRLVDAYIDGHKYVFGKRAVLYGEVDLVAAMASFLDEIGVVPAVCATGAATEKFKSIVQSGIEHNRSDLIIAEDTDFATMLEACRETKPDIIIGNSKGYYLASRLGVPLVRVGFPIHDRVGGPRTLHVGYGGTQRLFDRIVNGLIGAMQESSGLGYSYI